MAALAWRIWIGWASRRASSALTNTDSTMPTTTSRPVRQAEARSGSNASSSGCSMKTTQPSGVMVECEVSTSRPLGSWAIVTSGLPGVSAAFTWARFASVVFCSTRLMSGCAMRAPLRSIA